MERKRLIIPGSIYEQILDEGRKAAPIEACGYLAGRGDEVLQAFPMTNVDQSPEHFTLDPKEQFAVIRQVREAGMEILSVYHTHPVTPARPSAEDIRLAYDPNIIYTIASLIDGQTDIKAFFIIKGTVKPVDLMIQ